MLLIGNNTVEMVDSFKVLGVNIDQFLSFEKHVTELKLVINKKLFSLKRLKFLVLTVEVLTLEEWINGNKILFS